MSELVSAANRLRSVNPFVGVPEVGTTLHGLTANVRVCELSSGIGSVVAAETVALSEKLPAAVAVDWIVISRKVSTGTDPSEHVIVVVPLHVPCGWFCGWTCLAVAETNLTPLGSVSVNVTPCAVSGPKML